nr:MAG TPA: hypothetical protein [Caudoviricetes sp.]
MQIFMKVSSKMDDVMAKMVIYLNYKNVGLYHKSCSR